MSASKGVSNYGIGIGMYLIESIWSAPFVKQKRTKNYESWTYLISSAITATKQQKNNRKILIFENSEFSG